MATELEVRFCTDPSSSRRPLTALSRLVDAIQSTRAVDLTFRGFRVFAQESLNPIYEQRVRLDSGALLAALAEWDLPDYSISTRTAIIRHELDRDGGSIREALVPVRIGCIGGIRAGRTGDWWIDGDTRLS